MEEFEETDDLALLLSKLTDKQYKFWALMNEGRKGHVECYREAYDAENMSLGAISVEATRLWNNPKFTLIRRALKNAQVEQSVRTLEYRIQEMEAFAARAEAAGQYGASAKAIENAAKLEGHYVIKTQSVPSRNDELSILKEIAREGSKESLAFAMKEAKELGLQEELKEALGTVH